MKEHIAGPVNPPSYKIPVPDEYYHKSNNTSPQGRKANAVFVILGDTNVYLNEPPTHLLICTARNSDINGIMFSMKQMEDRFNKKFQYDYVFLNEQPFDQSFKE